MNHRFRRSTQFLVRAEEVIPLGSQTFSKSKAQYPVGFSPLFAQKARGALMWDIDGNKYIDLVSNLASITIGYANKAQNRAVWQQMKRSTGMSLPSKLETIVAEKISALVPSMEMMRFAKNGSDATSAAIRLSRAYTSRDHVAVCGYHGWQDWYIGSTNRNKGVPKVVQGLTHTFSFNDLGSLQRIFDEYGDNLACVVLEPMNRQFPNEGFLQAVVDMCEKNGSICVFDETITGFRFAPGGAQELFGVNPHLSTFGKGIANGYPLSVVGGRKDIMAEMHNIFFSGTFGGELLSLAAANHVLDRHLKNEVTPQLSVNGSELFEQQETILRSHNLSHMLKFTGHASWKFYDWYDIGSVSAVELKTLFAQEMFESGILIIGTNNVSLSHTKRVRNSILDRFNSAIFKIKQALDSNLVRESLKFYPLEPVMKIR